MISSLIFMATMVVTGIPTAILFIPWCWLTGNVLPLYKGTRFMLSSSCWMAGVRFHVEGLRARAQGPGVHLHVEPRLESRPAGADLADSGAHLGLHEALADGAAGSGHRLPAGRVHRRGPQRQRSRRQGERGRGPSACWPRACTSRPLWKARARRTAACCPSRKARSFWPWRPARRASRFRSMARRRFWAKAACA